MVNVFGAGVGVGAGVGLGTGFGVGVGVGAGTLGVFGSVLVSPGFAGVVVATVSVVLMAVGVGIVDVVTITGV